MKNRVSFPLINSPNTGPACMYCIDHCVLILIGDYESVTVSVIP